MRRRHGNPVQTGGVSFGLGCEDETRKPGADRGQDEDVREVSTRHGIHGACYISTYALNNKAENEGKVGSERGRSNRSA